MSPQTQISPTTLTTNQTATPFIEYGFAIKTQAEQITDLQLQINELKAISHVSESLCKAYDDLHKIRLISLISLPAIFLLLVIIYIVIFGQQDESFKDIFRFAGIPTAVGLLIEAFWIPGKIKMIDDRIKDQSASLASAKSDITTLRTKVDSLQAVAVQQPTSPQSSSSKSHRPTQSRPSKKTQR